VVLKKWVPLGSLREEFLILGRKFVSERNWGRQAVDETALSFYYLFIHHKILFVNMLVEIFFNCSFVKLFFAMF